VAGRIEEEMKGLMVVLETPCQECEGQGATGEDSDYGSRFACSECDGTGYVLTEMGERIYAFVEHMAKRMRFRSESPWPLG
jgi:DnaJ-class molecular chaperone